MRLVAILSTLAAATLSPASQSGVPAAAAGDVRAVWVLRASLDSPAAVDAMIRTVADAGFNTVLVQVRGRGEAYYRSRIEPQPADLASQPGFDPLALAITRGHEAGLAVHAWVNVNLVSSAVTLPRATTHIVRQHPEWLMVPAALARDLSGVDPRSDRYLTALARWSRDQRDTVEGLYLSPITPAAQDYTVSVVRELVSSYPIDGLHLDYIRFPGAAFDYSAAGLAAFRASRLPHSTPAEIAAIDAAARRAPTAWADRLPDSWSDFRRARLTELVERIADTARTARPGLIVSAAVVPDADEARRSKAQDWAAWARDGLLDAICPMAYTTDPTVFARQVAAVRDAGAGLPVWAGVGAYRLTADETVRHVRLARDAGAGGFALFSYDSIAAGRRGGAAYFTRLRSVLQDNDAPR
ncbi:MAG TPA: family 10 glycosylhydrolase [Vicinamibacterales bacterium]|nr:family 10 glycosylhydrolase [Vicinamibacterales bacterium]